MHHTRRLLARLRRWLGGGARGEPDVLASMKRHGLYAAIVEGSNDAILAKDTAGRIVAWNRGAERLYGYPAREILGRSIEVLVPPERLDEVREILDAIQRREEVAEHETVRVTRDGRRLEVALTVSPLCDEAGRVLGASAIARDITARKAAERRAAELARALSLEHAELERVVYTVAHDLKSPLVTTAGFLEVLREELRAGNAAAVEDALERLSRANRRMSRLVEDLLAVSRAGRRPERPEDVDLAEVAHQIETDLAQSFEEAGARLAIGPLPRLWIDPVWAREIVENLAANALKYGCPEPGGQVEVGADVHEGHVELWVRDGGPGIPEDQREHVFDLFVRLHDDQGGSGVGLAIVARLAERLGGRAWVDDTAEGATVRVLLPRRS